MLRNCRKEGMKAQPNRLEFDAVLRKIDVRQGRGLEIERDQGFIGRFRPGLRFQKEARPGGVGGLVSADEAVEALGCLLIDFRVRRVGMIAVGQELFELGEVEVVELDGIGTFRIRLRSQGNGAETPDEVFPQQSVPRLYFRTAAKRSITRSTALWALLENLEYRRIDQLQGSTTPQAFSESDREKKEEANQDF